MAQSEYQTLVDAWIAIDKRRKEKEAAKKSHTEQIEDEASAAYKDLERMYHGRAAKRVINEAGNESTIIESAAEEWSDKGDVFGSEQGSEYKD